MRAFSEWFRELFEAIARRPGPALLALAAGLGAGLLIRAALPSGSEQASTVAARTEPAQQAPSRQQPKPKPQPKPQPKPSAPASSRGDASSRIPAALDAVERYAGQASGARVGAAIAPLDGSMPPLSAGTVAAGKPWSVMKVPAAAAYLDFKRRAAGAASGEETIPKGSPEREGLGEALVQSDNLAIRRRVQEMIDAQGPGPTAAAINTMLANGGSEAQISSRIDPSIDSLQLGTGNWRLDEAAQWFQRLQIGSDCLGIAEDDRVFILRQLRAAPSALSWGAASVLDQGQIALKPGWGADGADYTVEQLVIVGNGSEAAGFPTLSGGYAMALMAVVPSSSPGAFEAGQRQLAGLAAEIEEQMGTPGPEVEAGSVSC